MQALWEALHGGKIMFEHHPHRALADFRGVFG